MLFNAMKHPKVKEFKFCKLYFWGRGQEMTSFTEITKTQCLFAKTRCLLLINHRLLFVSQWG